MAGIRRGVPGMHACQACAAPPLQLRSRLSHQAVLGNQVDGGERHTVELRSGWEGGGEQVGWEGGGEQGGSACCSGIEQAAWGILLGGQ